MCRRRTSAHFSRFLTYCGTYYGVQRLIRNYPPDSVNPSANRSLTWSRRYRLRGTSAGEYRNSPMSRRINAFTGSVRTPLIALVARAPPPQLYVVSGEVVSGRGRWPVNVLTPSGAPPQVMGSLNSVYTPSVTRVHHKEVILTRHAFTRWKFARWHLYWGPGTVGKVSTDRQYKKFSSTDNGFFCTVGI